MAAPRTTAAKPPRYDEAVGDASDSEATASGPALSVAPASATRGAAHLPAGSFDRPATEDEPFDRDRPRKPRATFDGITRALKLDAPYSAGATFKWCRDTWTHPIAFSRCYVDPDVLVDLFPNAGPDVIAEVERKQAALRVHNAEAKLMVEAALEAAVDDADLANRMLVLRRDRMVPYSYVPIVGLPVEIDAAALPAGTILDLHR